MHFRRSTVENSWQGSHFRQKVSSMAPEHDRSASTKTAVQEFLSALHAGNVERVRTLLETHTGVRDAINEPISYFNSRPIARATKNLPLLDLLLSYGADLNLKSTWWAGGFGLLETGVTPEEAAPLIARGATVDVFAAAHLGMFDRLRELVDADPSLVRARGGDGKTPLHCARTVEIAQYLIDRGADIDARDVDHESRPAQYLVRDAPDVARLLVSRGAWFDIFLAIGLRDAALVQRSLRDDAEALDHRIGQGKYHVAHDGTKPATREEIGDRRGDVYRWVFDANISAIEAAAKFGNDEILALLLDHATPSQRFLAACAKADRATAEAIAAAHPDLVGSLRAEEMRLIADKAQGCNTAAVALMLDLGFDQRVAGPDHGDAMHWAAFHGNTEMVRILLRRDPPIGVRDSRYHATPLGWCVFGAVEGWARDRGGDYPATVRLLLDSGETFEPSILPTGRDDVDAVLRAHLSGPPAAPADGAVAREPTR